MTIMASQQGNTDLVKQCLAEDCQGVLLEYCDAESGGTPLVWAAASNQVDVCRLLVEHGAALESKGTEFGRVCCPAA